MLYSMKTLNLKKIQHEFLMLAMFHQKEFKSKVDSLPIDESMKERMRGQTDAFLQKLFDIANFTPQADTYNREV